MRGETAVNRTYTIVVGVDGSDASRQALRWAVHEAAAREGMVQAVTAWRWDLPSGLDTAGYIGDERERATDMLAQEVARLAAGVPVASQVMEGRPAEVLGTAAREADLLVLGSHGHSRVWHTVLGSVAEECIRKATCPVVVIPPPRETTGPALPPAVTAARRTGRAAGSGSPAGGSPPPQ
jgi:nucleotide-binding universal stress UspA family protein